VVWEWRRSTTPL